MQTSIKSFNSIIVSERPKNHLKYTDIVSYSIGIGLLPIIFLHAMVIFPFVGLNLVLSNYKLDTLAEILEYSIRYFSTIMTKIYKFVAYSLSILLCGVYYSLITYAENKPVINAMNPVSLHVVDFSKLPNVHQNIVLKNGFFAVWWREVVMFSLLPVLRYTMMYNPFLFILKLSFTNQISKDLPVDERTSDNLNKMEILFHNYEGRCKESERLDSVTFNPNFTETDADDGKFNDIGIQFSSFWTCYIQMELPKYKKTVEQFAYDSPISIDGVKKKKLDRLWIPFQNPFYPVCAYVEITLTECGSIQHPMLGIFSDSKYSELCWSSIDNLFQNKVVPYLEEQYMNSKAAPLEIISNIEE